MHPEIARAWSVLLIRGVCNVLFAFVAFLPSRLDAASVNIRWLAEPAPASRSTGE